MDLLASYCYRGTEHFRKGGSTVAVIALYGNERRACLEALRAMLRTCDDSTRFGKDLRAAEQAIYDYGERLTDGDYKSLAERRAKR